MNNNFNIERIKKKKMAKHMILGAILSLLLGFCMDVILWAIGALGTTINVGQVLLMNLIFVFLFEAILGALEFWRTSKK